MERLSSAGSDVLHHFIQEGRSEDLAALIAFYKLVLKKSNLEIEDLKPDNIRKSEDGKWVLSYWTFGLYGKNLERVHLEQSISEALGRGILEMEYVIIGSKTTQKNTKLLIERLVGEGLLLPNTVTELLELLPKRTVN